jgi:hypothetical protein
MERYLKEAGLIKGGQQRSSLSLSLSEKSSVASSDVLVLFRESSQSRRFEGDPSFKIADIFGCISHILKLFGKALKL